MIVKIDKGSSFRGVINYHEEKVEKGIATLIDNNLLSDNKKGYIDIMNETCSKNNRLQDNKVIHLSFSLAVGENLSDQKFKKLASDYLKERGYQNNPILMYRHFDKDHQHIHVVTSSVDFDGKKIKEYNDHFINKKVCRELEHKYGLKITLEGENSNSSLSELNQEKYSLFKGLKLGLLNEKASLHIQKFPVLSEIIESLSDITNTQIKEKIGEELFKNTFRLLDNEGLIYNTDKTKLLIKLDYLYKISSSKEDFISNLTQKGIYQRQLVNQGKPYFTYGLNGKYFKEKQLPKKYAYSNLISISQKVVFTKEMQKGYLKRMISKTLKSSNSIEDFENKLQLNGIKCIKASNTAGVYGISFKQMNIESAEIFKGSEIDRSLSWKSLNDFVLTNTSVKPLKGTVRKITTNINIKSPEKKAGNAITPKDILKPLGDGAQTSDEFERQKLKRKFNNPENPDENLDH